MSENPGLGETGDDVAKLVEILKAELPGWESKVSPATDSIVIDGILRLGIEIAQDSIYRHPVYSGGAETIAKMLVDRAREFAIEQVGLAPVIAEREKRAHERGRQDGLYEGREAGRREGRKALLAELAEALRDSGHSIGGTDE
jgi:flagellar biosynthesis/type III secretory pathway protein FliH